MDYERHKLLWENSQRNRERLNKGIWCFWFCAIVYFVAKVVESCVERETIWIVAYSFLVVWYIGWGYIMRKKNRKQREEHERFMKYLESLRGVMEESENGNEGD